METFNIYVIWIHSTKENDGDNCTCHFHLQLESLVHDFYSSSFSRSRASLELVLLGRSWWIFCELGVFGVSWR